MAAILTLVGVGIFFLLLFIAVIWKDVRPYFQPKKMYAIIINADRSRSLYFLTPKDGAFVIGTEKYSILPECVYKLGRFNTGACYYLRDVSAPIDFKTLHVANEQVASEAFAAQESHVAKELMASVNSNPFSPMMMVLLLSIVIVGSVGFAYWKLSTPIAEIHDSVTSEIQTVPTSVIRK